MAFFINGKRVLHKGAKGIASTTDVCITPALVPLAFTNQAKTEDLVNCDDLFTINGNPVATFNSYFQKTSGDEEGTLGGVLSGTTAGKAIFKTHAQGFTVNGVPVVCEGDMVISNNNNSTAGPVIIQETIVSKDAQIALDKYARKETNWKKLAGQPIFNNVF